MTQSETEGFLLKQKANSVKHLSKTLVLCLRDARLKMESVTPLSWTKDYAMDVSDFLWRSNESIAKQTLKTPFVQHMQSGDLQADFYVKFMIQDLNYLVKVTDMLKVMSERDDLPDKIRLFLEDRYKEYKEYADETLEQFSLSGVSDIKPIPAMKKYLSDYEAIMEGEEPVFFAVSLLPCVRLWIWLATHLKEKEHNAYFIWKKNNMQGYAEDQYRKLLDEHLKTPEQVQKANKIFHQQMQNEHDFFAASFQEEEKKK